MTHRDIYIKFMIGYDKANVTSSYPSLTEYEIATFLDKAYLALIAQKVTGNNSRHIGFEQDLKVTEDLGPLIITKKNYTFDNNPLPYVHNAIKWPLPSDWLYFVSGELQRGGVNGKQWDIRLIDHNTASKFYTTAYNIPWIKRPVCYIEGNNIFTLYDSIYQADGTPSLTLTYIKTPKKFMVDDGVSNDIVDTDEIPPKVTSAYQNGTEVSIRVGETIRIKCENGSLGNIGINFNREVISVTHDPEDETYLIITGLSKGYSPLELDNTYFTNWQYILKINVIADYELDLPIIEVIGSRQMEVGDTRTIRCYYHGNPVPPSIDDCRADSELVVLSNTIQGSMRFITVLAISAGTPSVLFLSSDHPEWEIDPILFTINNPTAATTEYNSTLGAGIYYVKGDITYNAVSVTNPVFRLSAGLGYLTLHMYGTNGKIYTFDESLNKLSLQDISDELFYNSVSLEDVCDVIKLRIIYTLIHKYNVTSIRIRDREPLSNITTKPSAYIILSDAPLSEPTTTSSMSLTVGGTPGQIQVTDSIIVGAYSNVSNNSAISFIDRPSGNTISVTAANVGTATGIIFTEDAFETPLKVNFTVSAASGVTLEHDYLGQYFALNFHQADSGDSGSGGGQGHSPAPTPVIQILTGDIWIQSENIYSSGLTITKNNPGSYLLTATVQNGNLLPEDYCIVASTSTNKNIGDELVPDAVGNQKFAITSIAITGNVRIAAGESYRLYLVCGETVKQKFGIVRHVALLNPTVSTLPSSKSVTYNGQDQQLINPGSVTGGTFEYKLGVNGTWSSSIPTAKDADDYPVYYRVVGDTGYKDISYSEAIMGKINRKVMNVTWTPSTFVYDGEVHKPTPTVSGLYSGDSVTFSVSALSAYTVGLHTAYIDGLTGTGCDNYEFTPTSFNFNIVSQASVLGGLERRVANSGTTYNLVIENGTIRSAVSSHPYIVEIPSGTFDRQLTVYCRDAGEADVSVYIQGQQEPLVVPFRVNPYISRTSRSFEVGDPADTIEFVGAGVQSISLTSNTGAISAQIIQPEQQGGFTKVQVDILAEGTDGIVVTPTYGSPVTVTYTVIDPSAPQLVNWGDRFNMVCGDTMRITVPQQFSTFASSDSFVIDAIKDEIGSTDIVVKALSVGNCNLGFTFGANLDPSKFLYFTVSAKTMNPMPQVENLSRTIYIGQHDTISATSGQIIAEQTGRNFGNSGRNYADVTLVNGVVDVYAKNPGTIIVPVVVESGEVFTVQYSIENNTSIGAWVDGSTTRTIYTDKENEEIVVRNDYISSISSSDTSILTVTKNDSTTVAVKPRKAGSAVVTIFTNGNYELKVNYTVQNAPIRPTLYTYGNAISDEFLTEGESNTMVVSNASIYRFYLTGGLSLNDGDHYCSLTNSGSASKVTANTAQPTYAYVVHGVSTYTMWDGNNDNQSQNRLAAYYIRPYLAINGEWRSMPPLNGLTELVASIAHVYDYTYDEYLVLNVKWDSSIQYEYPLVAHDGECLKVVLKDDGNGTYKYLCWSNSGAQLSSVAESTEVTENIFTAAKRILRRYGWENVTNEGKQYVSSTSDITPTYINPSPNHRYSITGSSLTDTNIHWQLGLQDCNSVTLKLRKSELSDSTKLPVFTNPDSVTVTFSSSDTTVATVNSSGQITAGSASYGDCIIKATLEEDSTYYGRTVWYKLIVLPDTLPTINKTPERKYDGIVTCNVGDSDTITVTNGTIKYARVSEGNIYQNNGFIPKATLTYTPGSTTLTVVPDYSGPICVTLEVEFGNDVKEFTVYYNVLESQS